MASNNKIIACGAKATIVGMILRFIVGPLSVGIACIAVGLRGDVLRIAIVQVTTSTCLIYIPFFIYNYHIHAEVVLAN